MKSFEEICKAMGANPEDVAKLRDRPETQRRSALLAKILDGSISAEERAEFDEITKSTGEIRVSSRPGHIFLPPDDPDAPDWPEDVRGT